MLKNLFRKIGKFILFLITFIIILVVVAYLTVSYWIVPVVNKVIPTVTQTSASLQSADISLLKGRFALKGLKIGNPEGFTTSESFKLDEISVQFQPISLFSDKIIVDKILINGTQIAMELNNYGQINLMTLNENVQTYLGENKVKENTKKQKVEPKKESAKSVVIKDLEILNSSVKFAVMNKASTLKLPNIQEKNIGEKKTTTIPEATMMIVNKLTVQPVQEITKAGQKALTNALNFIQEKQGNTETVKSLKKSLSQFFS